jgi:hypothetical protein
VPPHDACPRGEVARALVSTALDTLYAHEIDLPAHVHERTFAGQLGRYLDEAVKQRTALGDARWSVDLEYNRAGGDRRPWLRSMKRSQRWSASSDGQVLRCAIGPMTASFRTSSSIGEAASSRTSWCASDLDYRHAFLILHGDTRDSTSLDDIARYVRRLPEARAVHRWRRGHAIAAQRQRELVAKQGPQPRRLSLSRSLH